MSEEVTLPVLGESVTEGTVSRWLKKVGDTVAVDEPLVEISTDKVDTEIPSPVAGVLLQIRVQEDETAEVGSVLAVIGEPEAEPHTITEPPATPAAPAAEGSNAAGTVPIEPYAPEAYAGSAEQYAADAHTAAASAFQEPAAAAQIPVGYFSTQSPAAPGEPEPVIPSIAQPFVPPAAPASFVPAPPPATPAAPAPTAAQPGPSGLDITPSPYVPELAHRDIPEAIGTGPYVTPLVRKLADENGVDLDSVHGSGVGGRIRKQDILDAAAAPPAVQGAPIAMPAGPGQPTAAPAGAPVPSAPVPAGTVVPPASPAPAGVAVPPPPAPPVSASQPAFTPPAPVPATPVAPAASPAQPVQPTPPAARPAPPAPPAPPVRRAMPAPSVQTGDDEFTVPGVPTVPHSPLAGTTEKISRLRATIARRMVESLQVSAQLTATVEVDLTRISRLRAQVKDEFKAREGVSLTYLPFIAKAALEGLREFPKINATIDTEAGMITYSDGEHLGIAVDTPRGLLVPVIRGAGDLSVTGLAKKIADLGARTRNNQLSPDELSGGTFTLSNYGGAGTLFDTPIINQPQVAILGVGAITRRPVVVDDPNLGETITIRDMMYLSLSYDHRLIDGADAARFLSMVKTRLEAGDFGSEF